MKRRSFLSCIAGLFGLRQLFPKRKWVSVQDTSVRSVHVGGTTFSVKDCTVFEDSDFCGFVVPTKFEDTILKTPIMYGNLSRYNGRRMTLEEVAKERGVELE